jgi:hypothetical protein
VSPQGTTYSASEWHCSKAGWGGLRVQVSSGTCQPAAMGVVSEEIVAGVERRSARYGYLSSQDVAAYPLSTTGWPDLEFSLAVRGMGVQHERFLEGEWFHRICVG